MSQAKFLRRQFTSLTIPSNVMSICNPAKFRDYYMAINEYHRINGESHCWQPKIN